MCDIPSRARVENELTEGEWYKVVDDLKAIGVSGIGITGGEPLISPHTLPLVRYISRAGLPVHLSTNGFLISKDLAHELIAAGLNTIAVSIDSAHAQTNDRLRGREGAYDKAVAAVKTLSEVRKSLGDSRLRITVGAVLSHANLDSALGVVDLAQSIGADKVSFLPVMAKDFDKKGREGARILRFHEGDREKTDSLISKLLELQRQGCLDNSRSFIESFRSYLDGKQFPARCRVGYTALVIGAHGEVYPCFSYLQWDKPVGDLKRRDLAETWRSSDYQKVREDTAQCLDCYSACHQEFNLLFDRPFASVLGIVRSVSRILVGHQE
jgi:MoaA/NifB/PqqE/SkfB family radical SAM enzyme